MKWLRRVYLPLGFTFVIRVDFDCVNWSFPKFPGFLLVEIGAQGCWGGNRGGMRVSGFVIVSVGFMVYALV